MRRYILMLIFLNLMAMEVEDESPANDDVSHISKI